MAILFISAHILPLYYNKAFVSGLMLMHKIIKIEKKTRIQWRK